MEIAVPEGCTLASIRLETETQDVFDALVKEHDAYKYGGTSVQTEHGSSGRTYTQETAYWTPEDGPRVFLEAPKHYVTVTVTDA